MPEFGVEQARQRVLDTMYAGNWQNVDAQLTAYGAAVRAEERRHTLDEALAALKDYADAHEDQRDCVQACIGVVQRLL